MGKTQQPAFERQKSPREISSKEPSHSSRCGPGVIYMAVLG